MALGGMSESNAKRSVNSEINMVPMIDLLVCCITFLMLTAVWSTQGRITAEGTAMQGPAHYHPPDNPRARLHLTATGDEPFTLSWREKGAELRSVRVPRRPGAEGKLPELSEALKREWSARPDSAKDGAPVLAVVHVDNRVRYAEMAAIMGALQTPQARPGEDRRSGPSFTASLAD